HAREHKAAIPMQRKVAAKQNSTNFGFQTSEKSTVARSPNNSTGSGTKKTNLFNFAANSSSIHPSLRNRSPRSMRRKIGTVALRLNIKFSMIMPRSLQFFIDGPAVLLL